VAVFHEALDASGARCNIELLRDELMLPDGTMRAKPQRFDHGYNEQIVDIRGTQTVWESRIELAGDADDGGYWHYTLRCPTCPQNVSARWDKLRPIIAELLDTGASSEELSRINGRLQEMQ
jgi:hypothetical protein